jgi:purine-binding chemotaxis protein CheW
MQTIAVSGQEQGGREAAATAGTACAAELVSFAIGNDQYGVDIMSVREIKGWSEITHLPKQPDYVRGVLNLRGVMVPIIDLRCRFGQGLTEATPLHIVIIVQVADMARQVQPVPRAAQSARIDFLSGLVTIDSGMIALIDLEHLLSAPAEDDYVTQVSAA